MFRTNKKTKPEKKYLLEPSAKQKKQKLNSLN